MTLSYEGKNSGGIKSPKQTKTAKITKRHNGHTRGEFVLIILFKKRGYFIVFSVVNQRYLFPIQRLIKRSNSQRLSCNLTPRKMKGHVPTRTAVTPISLSLNVSLGRLCWKRLSHEIKCKQKDSRMEGVTAGALRELC